jgi:hypothetical protein
MATDRSFGQHLLGRPATQVGGSSRRRYRAIQPCCAIQWALCTLGAVPDDRIQCLECGRWLRALGGHLVTHDMTAREYKISHGILMSRPLVGADTSARMSSKARQRVERDPDEYIRRIRKAHAEPPRPTDDEVLKAVRSHYARAAEEHAQQCLEAAGWASWQDAADWAIAQNAGWAEVGARIGMARKAVKAHAERAGVYLSASVRREAQEFLALAAEHVAEHGTLTDCPRRLVKWLSRQRALVKQGKRSRVHTALDKLDPGWWVPRNARITGTCEWTDCDAANATLRGFCARHYDRWKRTGSRHDVSLVAGARWCLASTNWQGHRVPQPDPFTTQIQQRRSRLDGG